MRERNIETQAGAEGKGIVLKAGQEIAIDKLRNQYLVSTDVPVKKTPVSIASKNDNIGLVFHKEPLGQVFRKIGNGKLEVLNADLGKAINGDPKDNILLQPQDRVFVHKDVQRIEPATVEVQGDVPRPGKYPLGANMTAAQLVKLAGGLKRSAYTEVAELTPNTVVGVAAPGRMPPGSELPICP